MKVFATEKNIGEREVRHVLKAGSIINVSLQNKEGFANSIPIKIAKFTVGPNNLFVQGTHANGSYVLNLLLRTWMCLSDTEMTSGKIIGGVHSGHNEVIFDGAVGEFYYNEIERNVRKMVPVEVGDIIRKPGNSSTYQYKILAVASDGAIFIERIIPENSCYHQSMVTSMMIRTNDLSAYSVFDGLDVINA